MKKNLMNDKFYKYRGKQIMDMENMQFYNERRSARIRNFQKIIINNKFN